MLSNCDVKLFSNFINSIYILQTVVVQENIHFCLGVVKDKFKKNPEYIRVKLCVKPYGNRLIKIIIGRRIPSVIG